MSTSIGKVSRQAMEPADDLPSQNLPSDPRLWTFGQRLSYHLFVHATRPYGSPTVNGKKPWAIKEFADAVKKDPSVVRKWLKRGHIPPDIKSIEIALFEDDKEYEEWRTALRAAAVNGRHRTRASTSRANPAQPPEGDETLPGQTPVNEKEVTESDPVNDPTANEGPVVGDMDTAGFKPPEIEATPVASSGREAIPSASDHRDGALEPSTAASDMLQRELLKPAQSDENVSEQPPVVGEVRTDDNCTDGDATPVGVPIFVDEDVAVSEREDVETTRARSPVSEPLPAGGDQCVLASKGATELSGILERETESLPSALTTPAFARDTEERPSLDGGAVGQAKAGQPAFDDGFERLKSIWSDYFPTTLWIIAGTVLALVMFIPVPVIYQAISGDPLEFAVGSNGILFSLIALACAGAVLGHLAQKRRRRKAMSVIAPTSFFH